MVLSMAVPRVTCALARGESDGETPGIFAAFRAFIRGQESQ